MANGTMERPTSVSVAVAIGWIGVVLDIITGVSLILLANNDTVLEAYDITGDIARSVGIGAIIGGLILAVVVATLGRGSNVSRILVSAVMAVRAAWAVYALFAIGSHALAEAIGIIAISITALALLWNDKANAFYAGR